MINNPKVSIIIPVYNGSNYLKEAIDSAIAQTYKNIEIIVVNDGSSDDGATETIAKSYGDKIKYYYKKNGGVATALNYGIKKMTGDYFSWLSHDDMYYADKIEKQISFLNKLNNKNVVIFSNYSILESGKKNTIIINHDELQNKPKYALLRGCVNGITVLIPRFILDEFGEFDSNLRCTQDYDYWLRIQKKYLFVHMKDVLSITRIHPNQDTNKSPHTVTESDKLWIKMMNSLSDLEKTKYEGSIYIFYVEMLKFLRALTNYNGAMQYCREKLDDIESVLLENFSKLKTKITVLTPTYNRVDYIADTIQSILGQSYGDFKYIIIDDGSKDETTRIVNQLIKDCDNCLYIYQNNIGESKTVNRGWGICDSEYFVQINSDDLVSPNLFKEMVKFLEKNKKSILAYPDFYIINKDGKVIDDEVNSDFNFLKDLSMFSCYAACPGAFIRKSSLSDWEKIRNSNYLYISDVDMIWRMALVGDINRVPGYLASWRSHDQGISNDRYKSISEIEGWIEDYFNMTDLPLEIKGVEVDCRKSIYNHFARLMEKSGLDYAKDAANYYREKAKLPVYKYSNLQVGDNDLIGNKFNGHDLHLYLRNHNIESYHLTVNKQSEDNNTYVLGADKFDRDGIMQFAHYMQSVYDLDCTANTIMYDIIYNKLFLDADVVHLHLMHNGILDLNVLPIMSKMKPIVWTLHDTWSVLFDPTTADAEFLFPSSIKNFSLNYEIKRNAIQNSDIVYITASKYIKKIVEESPLYEGKKVFHVPFGINLDIFYPRGRAKIRKLLGFGRNEKIVILRGNIRNTKGLDYIEYVMKNIGSKYDIRFLVVGGNDLIGVPEDVKVTYYGWLKDDNFMAELFSAADLLLMPSTREAFGMMAIEAMACGAVPVVIDGTALPDTINAPECGISSDRNHKAYCDAVEKLLCDNADRMKREKRCIQYIEKNHNINTYIDSIKEVYKYAMKNHTLDYYAANLLNSIKLNNETFPRLTIVANPHEHNISKKERARRILSRTKTLLKDEGILITTKRAIKKIQHKIKSKKENILGNNLIVSVGKFSKSLKKHGINGTYRKLIEKIQHKSLGRK